MHSYITSRLAEDLPALEQYYGVPSVEFSSRLPSNAAKEELPRALAAAHEHYGVKEYVLLDLGLVALLTA